MPPALSDDEMSDASGVGDVTTPPPSKRGKKISSYVDIGSDEDENDGSTSDAGKAKKRDNGRARSATRTNGAASTAGKKAKEESKEESDEGNEADDGDEDDDEDGEDEYEVQQIVGHMLDGDKPRFRVIWKGYENPSDHTWEPEENLADNASEILTEYILKIGGRKNLFEKPAKGKKRGRQPASATPTTATKRSRKSEEHPADRESPAEVQKVFKPPAGSWEDDVVDVEMFRGDSGELRVFLTWKNGSKSQHAAEQAYVRCPQRILRFYESRISFKTPTE